MNKLIHDPLYGIVAKSISCLFYIKSSDNINDPLKIKCQEMIDVLFSEFPEASAQPSHQETKYQG